MIYLHTTRNEYAHVFARLLAALASLAHACNGLGVELT